MKVKGVAAVEYIILVPLMLLMVMFVFYFFWATMAFINYSNAANFLAHSLNMRQSGFEAAAYHGQGANPSGFLAHRHAIDGQVLDAQHVNRTTIQNTVNIINATAGMPPNAPPTIVATETPDNIILYATYYMIWRIVLNQGPASDLNRLFMPGTRVSSIRVSMQTNGVELQELPRGVSMSNTVINVWISFYVFGIPITVNGYNIIV